MPTKHIVQPGDCIESIAERYGFFPQTVWDHALNEELRKQRKRGQALLIGDEVMIPDKVEREQEVATSKRHVFRRRGVPAKIIVRLAQGEEPRANTPYILRVDGETTEGVTDANGRIEQWVDPRATIAELELGPEEIYDVQIGHLSHLSDQTGWQERLQNLGYIPDASNADATALSLALAEFQFDHALPTTGTPDASTLDTLDRAHGS